MIPFTLFLICLAVFVVTIIFVDHIDNDYVGLLFFFGGTIGFFCMLITLCNSVRYEQFPVKYEVMMSKTKIVVVTDYGVFQSNKIEDINNFTKNKAGFIKVGYNVYGADTTQEFITE